MGRKVEGHHWRLQCSCAVAVAAFFVGIAACGALVDRDWTAWLFGVGALVVVAPFALRVYQMRLVTFDSQAITFKRFFSSRQIAWAQVQSLDVEQRRAPNGRVLFAPTVYCSGISSGCTLPGLIGSSRTLVRVAGYVATIEAARNRYAPPEKHPRTQ